MRYCKKTVSRKYFSTYRVKHWQILLCNIKRPVSILIFRCCGVNPIHVTSVVRKPYFHVTKSEQPLRMTHYSTRKTFGIFREVSLMPLTWEGLTLEKRINCSIANTGSSRIYNNSTISQIKMLHKFCMCLGKEFF